MTKNAYGLTKLACLKLFVKCFLTAYALCTVFHAPLEPGHYETAVDYAIASIYELLGAYDLKFVLVLILSAFCYSLAARQSGEKNHPPQAFFCASGGLFCALPAFGAKLL